MTVEEKRAKDRAWYKRNREKALASQHIYNEAHREEKRRYDRERHLENPERKRKQAREWARANPEKNKERSLAWCEANSERYKEGRHRWSMTNAKKNRERNLLKNYGLTSAQFSEMSESQGGVCAICGLPPEGDRHSAVLHVDHDHATGMVRKLLCWHCNAMLGIAKDSPEILRIAANYLESFSVDRPLYKVV